MLEKFSAMRNSADLSGSADSLGENQDSPSLEQLNDSIKQEKEQRKSRAKIEHKESQKADSDLENELSSIEIKNQRELNKFLKTDYSNNKVAIQVAQTYFDKQSLLGFSVSEKTIRSHINERLENNIEISTADKIKKYKEQLTKQGKSQTEILHLLLSKFENEESVSIWVENWRNFQKLEKFSADRPPSERRAIQNIISKADFTNENAFTTSLTEIIQSSEISKETKLEISRQFGVDVFSVDDMDNTLKEVENHKEKIENIIRTKSREKYSLDSEIKTLENELGKLALYDPKREELKTKIEQKKEILKKTETEINRLEKGKPKDISFQLREGFFAKLNDDGSRSIKIIEDGFAIKLPSIFLPLTTTKNLRAINLSFPYLALKNQNIANIIFSPNLINNFVPSKSQRDMGHLILSTLKIDDSQILSEGSIKQLNKDLSRLTSVQNGKSAQEKLIDLGVFDIASQSLDKEKFRGILKTIRENRGLNDDLFFEKIKNI